MVSSSRPSLAQPSSRSGLEPSSGSGYGSGWMLYWSDSSLSQIVMIQLDDTNFMLWKSIVALVIRGCEFDCFLFGITSCPNPMIVWFRNESSGNLEAIYTHYVDHGLRLLHGVHDGDGRAVLMCSCNDKIMRLYDLPSFEERGRIFSVEEIKAVDILDRSMFFTGDGAGKIRWRKLASLKPSYENCSSLAMECDCRLVVSKDQKQDADADETFNDTQSLQ
ncbi:hypothetical protein Sjap_021997 [Stephania japonica]|uniref:Uncharacterized protein n=1 Tax=Stephania japonica TaxID=461633 RepID=A0AAP0EQM6_9MAGN